jgi:Lar family restriction alleviation protein
MLRELPAPCPFCGSPATPPDLDGDDGSWVVVCPDCSATGPARPDKHDAIAAWNRRVIVYPAEGAFGETQ